MTINKFRYLVILGLFFFILEIIAVLYGDQSLPEELRQYNESNSLSGLTIDDWVIFIIMLFTLFANIGILFLIRWSRIIFSTGIIILAISSFMYGPYFITGFESTFGTLSAILDGIVIGALYFSNISNHFEPYT